MCWRLEWHHGDAGFSLLAANLASGTANCQHVAGNGAKAVSCAGGDRSAISSQENQFFKQVR